MGFNSVIGAGSVVKKNFEPYAIVAGIPARKNRETEYKTKNHPALCALVWKDDLIFG